MIFVLACFGYFILNGIIWHLQLVWREKLVKIAAIDFLFFVDFSSC
jgi:hypothetical protein